MTAEPTLCANCISGVRHEGTAEERICSFTVKNCVFLGTPTGRIEKIAGVDVYVSIPTGEYDKEKALLYLPGLFVRDLLTTCMFILSVLSDAVGVPLWNAQVSNYNLDWKYDLTLPLAYGVVSSFIICSS